MKYIVIIGRILFSYIFLMTIRTLMTSCAIGYAAASGVPFASLLVPFSGLIAFAGGISIILGYRAKWGAFLIILFLIPVTLMMHNFWSVTDSQMAANQHGNFIKNAALLGSAILIPYFGSGPLSFDECLKKREDKINKDITEKNDSESSN